MLFGVFGLCVYTFVSIFYVGGKGICLGTGNIRNFKAIWVVILLNVLSSRVVYIFYSDLVLYFLGNLFLFNFLVACLIGASICFG